LAWLLPVAGAMSAPWEFQQPRVVSERSAGVFHHIDPAGRSALAVSGDVVAIVWEDNRDGRPRVYVAFRKQDAKGFVSQRLSGEGEAYEPVVTAMEGGEFIFGWEENGILRVRRGTMQRLGSASTLDAKDAGQLALAYRKPFVHAAWSERIGRHARIRYTRINPAEPENTAEIVSASPSLLGDQLYPSVAVLPNHVWVAWEDRSEGHTRILAARSTNGQSFEPFVQVNPLRRGRRQVDFGKGPGATRVVLAAMTGDRVAAVWLDKRDFQGGYDVFAALTDASGGRFGPHERVQDDFGANIGQWHAGISHLPRGRLVAWWDDDRDGSSDIQISWRDGNRWSANLAVPGANGTGQETSPVAAVDEQGNLHLAWVERLVPDGPTRLLYLLGNATMP